MRLWTNLFTLEKGRLSYLLKRNLNLKYIPTKIEFILRLKIIKVQSLKDYYHNGMPPLH